MELWWKNGRTGGLAIDRSRQGVGVVWKKELEGVIRNTPRRRMMGVSPPVATNCIKLSSMESASKTWIFETAHRICLFKRKMPL